MAVMHLVMWRRWMTNVWLGRVAIALQPAQEMGDAELVDQPGDERAGVIDKKVVGIRRLGGRKGET